MAQYLSKFTLKTTTGIDRDDVTMGLAWSTIIDLDEADAQNLLYVAFNALFNDVAPGATKAMKDYLAPEVYRGAAVHPCKLYDITGHLDGSPAGSPIGTLLMPMPAQAAASPGLPAEVAMCATLEAYGRAAQPVERPDGADPGIAIDRPRQRYTGRFYLGPLAQNTAINDGNGAVRPVTQFRTDLRQAVNAVADKVAADSAAHADLAVWTRANQTLLFVEAVSTDNAFDTQRRRGPGATVRERLVVD